MLISMLAWVLRFGLFAYGNPTDGLWMVILSCIVYGMAFDFFNISGSLFVETTTDAKIRSSAQGLFMMMTNGFGAVLGSFTSGWLIDKYFTMSFTKSADLANYLQTDEKNSIMLNFIKEKKIDILSNGDFSSNLMVRDWHNIWLAFALYSLIIAIAFALLFKHKHNPDEVANVTH
jgi:NHS family xanthosine MFS transporter